MTTSRAAKERKGGNNKLDNTKKKRKEDFSKVSEDGYKGVNIVFIKSLHKIMFDIQDKPYFEWPRPMGGNPPTKNYKLRCSYHKDHGHQIENYKILKQFLEGLVILRALKRRIREMMKRTRSQSRD